MELTARQQSVLDFIRAHQQRDGFAPTVREICSHLGLKGPAGVHRILGVLIEKGYLRSTPGKNRSWRLADVNFFNTLPLLGRIAAGMPIGVYENVEEQLPIDPKLYGHESCFAVRVTGDSMIEAHIEDGDLAVILPVNDADDGAIVAVIIDNILPEATLKIIHRRKNTIELRAANSAYPPLVFRGRDCGKVKVIGRYVGLIRRH